MKKKRSYLLINYLMAAFFLFNIGIVNKVYAESIIIPVSYDTFITEHYNLGGATSTHGSDNILYSIQVNDNYETYPLLWFNLSSFSNYNLEGADAILSLELVDAWGHNAPTTQSISVRELITSWDELTTSFANIGGTGFNENTLTGINLITRDVTYSGEPVSISFDIPSSIITKWITNSETNFGLILLSNTDVYQSDLLFSSREGAVIPTLSFEASQVPIPAAVWLFGSGLLGFIGLKRRAS